jgi:hypothetical protein
MRAGRTFYPGFALPSCAQKSVAPHDPFCSLKTVAPTYTYSSHDFMVRTSEVLRLQDWRRLMGDEPRKTLGRT